MAASLSEFLLGQRSQRAEHVAVPWESQVRTVEEPACPMTVVPERTPPRLSIRPTPEGALMSNPRETEMNWSQVRDRIDRGKTGDKIAVEDPATAPLGTDSEAGGSSTAGEHIARSAVAESAGMAAQRGARTPPRRALLGLALGAAAVVGVVAALALALVP
jgi:hypothetical protein